MLMSAEGLSAEKCGEPLESGQEHRWLDRLFGRPMKWNPTAEAKTFEIVQAQKASEMSNSEGNRNVKGAGFVLSGSYLWWATYQPHHP